jgi:hypothetical protein
LTACVENSVFMPKRVGFSKSQLADATKEVKFSGRQRICRSIAFPAGTHIDRQLDGKFADAAGTGKHDGAATIDGSRRHEHRPGRAAQVAATLITDVSIAIAIALNERDRCNWVSAC